jgi:hypothetical protein
MKAETEDPKRIDFFSGRFLDANDLSKEQQYFDARMRRHTLYAHGYGVVSGLQVEIISTASGPKLNISPGFVCDPKGHEVLVSQPVQWPMPAEGDVAYLYILWAERGIDFIPAPGNLNEGNETVPSRFDEFAEFKYSVGRCPDGIALARLRKSRRIWKLDKRFHVRKVHV